MARRLVLILLPLSLAGCDRVETLAVDVRSDHEVVFRVPSGRCIDALAIEKPDIKGDPVWRIERDPARQSGCVGEVTFPVAPPGFRTTLAAQVLPKASYAVAGMAQGYAISGNFDVPTRTPLL